MDMTLRCFVAKDELGILQEIDSVYKKCTGKGFPKNVILKYFCEKRPNINSSYFRHLAAPYTQSVSFQLFYLLSKPYLLSKNTVKKILNSL